MPRKTTQEAVPVVVSRLLGAAGTPVLVSSSGTMMVAAQDVRSSFEVLVGGCAWGSLTTVVQRQ